MEVILIDTQVAGVNMITVVEEIIEEIIGRMAEEEGIMMTGGETVVVVGGIIITIVVVMDVGGMIIGTVVGEGVDGVMIEGIMGEGGEVDIIMSVIMLVIAAVDVLEVEAFLDPPLEVEATLPLMGRIHREVTHREVEVEAILEVSLAHHPGIHAQKRPIKSANEATLREMRRRSTVGHILILNQNLKVMLKMLSRRISVPF
jgi:hypothetical protein